MKFKSFVNEEELTHDYKKHIIIRLNDMNDSEASEFGEWLYDELFGDDGYEYEGTDDFTKEEVIEMLGILNSDDLDYVNYMLDDESEEDESEEDAEAHSASNDNIEDSRDDALGEETIEEKTARIMKAKNRNKKKTKRFTKSKAQFRAGKSARKKTNRLNRVSRKKSYRKNKVSIKKYAKSYKKAIKSGKHVAKIRR